MDDMIVYFLYTYVDIVIIRLFVRAIILWVYWYWIVCGCLWVVGRWEGYVLANPLIPLVQHPILLSRLSLAGTGCMLGLFIGCAAQCALWFIAISWLKKIFLNVFFYSCVLASDKFFSMVDKSRLKESDLSKVARLHTMIGVMQA